MYLLIIHVAYNLMYYYTYYVLCTIIHVMYYVLLYILHIIHVHLCCIVLHVKVFGLI